jgi:CRISPR/Cas system CSM-associated protein Csm2 small subunit
MKFKEYLTEEDEEGVLSLSKRVLFTWKGLKIIDTGHGAKRIQQRSELTNDELKQLFREALDKVIRKKVHIGEKIVFWSKKLKQAFITRVEQSKNLTLITFYPRHDKPNVATHPYERQVVVEGETIRVVEID